MTTTPSTGNAQLDQVIATAEALAPAAGLISPQAGVAAAAAVTLAPIAIGLLNNAMQLTQAGALTQSQLAQMFVNIGQGIESTHAAWIALNANPKP